MAWKLLVVRIGRTGSCVQCRRCFENIVSRGFGCEGLLGRLCSAWLVVVVVVDALGRILAFHVMGFSKIWGGGG